MAISLTNTEIRVLKAFKIKADHCNLELDEVPLDPCDHPKGIGHWDLVEMEKRGLVSENEGYLISEPGWFELTPAGIRAIEEMTTN